MGHAGDMINRVKTNFALKNKDNKFRKAFFKQTVDWKAKFEFKKPTTEELEQSNKSNQEFVKREKMRSRLALVVAIVCTLIFFYLLAEMVGGVKLRGMY